MQDSNSYFYHALKIDENICIGCTLCMKSCPTEAIRVKEGKAYIYENKCIDCGECFRICPVRAIYIKQDDFELLLNYKYRIALVPAIFIGQFKEEIRTFQIYSCLKKLGFTHIYEVEHGVGFLIDMVKAYMEKNAENKPFISQFCPAVVRLIQVKFPALVKNIIHLKAPLDISALIISQRFIDAGIKSEDIGIFYIAPCAAKIAAVKSPVEKNASPISGVINMDFLYNKVQHMLTNLHTPAEPINHGLTGRDILWSLTGGESANFEGRCFAIDGIKNVIDFLDKIENGEIETDGLIEMRVCDQSCTGGELNPNNRFVAMERLKNRANYLDNKSKNVLNNSLVLSEEFYKRIAAMMEIEKIQPRSILKLDDDLQKALQMVEKIKKMESVLPSVDCGACGAPNCAALAEDIIRHEGELEDCIFVKKDEDYFYEIIRKVWGNDKIIEL